MKALVTGGVGFVGTNLCERLINDNHKVWSFDNYSTGFRSNHIKGANYGNIDITKSFTNWVEKVDVILSKLKDRERYVVECAFGLGTKPPMTFQAISKELGISRERTRNIFHGSVRKLRFHHGRS